MRRALCLGALATASGTLSIEPFKWCLSPQGVWVLTSSVTNEPQIQLYIPGYFQLSSCRMLHFPSILGTQFFQSCRHGLLLRDLWRWLGEPLDFQ